MCDVPPTSAAEHLLANMLDKNSMKIALELVMQEV
jgi:hypothetical protein